MFRIAFAFLITAGFLAAGLPPVARADDLPQQGTERVVAAVNEEAITIHDLDARVRLALLSADLPDTQENRQRIEPQVLRRLVDEHLELQEAARDKVEISNAEVAAGIANLERQNHMSKGQLAPFLESKGIDPQTIRDQIHAQLAWIQVVRGQLLPTIRIGDEEIDARLAEMKQGLNQPSYLAADIFLAVDDPRRENDVRQLAESLDDQLRSGASFGALARQFSQIGAQSGGDLGWVTRGMIDDSLFDALAKLEPGQISAPIRTREGYHILALRQRHDAGETLVSEPTLDMAQIDLTLLPSQSDQERAQTVASLLRAVGKDRSCDDYERHTKAIPTARFSRIGLLRPSEAPLDLRPALEKLGKGEMTQPIKLDNLDRFLIACDRTESHGGLPSREEVRRRIENDRLELLAERFLRDLRRAAYVDIRI